MRATALLLFALIPSFLEVQQKETEIHYLRVTSALVLVDFIAIDKEGRPVTDLRREEIDILEDGKTCRIESFYTPEQLRPPSRPGQEPGSASLPAAGERRDRTIIAIDSRCIDSNNFAHTVAAIRAFVEQHLTVNHELMIVEIYRGLRVLTPLTSHRQTLLGALDRLTPQTVYNPMDASRASLESAEDYLDELQLQVTVLEESLKSLSYSLAGLRGRKHVVFFSEGYPLDPKKLVEMNSRQQVSGVQDSSIRQEVSRRVGALKDPGVLRMVQEVVSVANKYGVSFYTIDARGLVAIPGIGTASISGDVAAPAGFSASGSPELGPTEEILGLYQQVQLNRIGDAQNTLTALAAGTDGLALYNTNNLGGILALSSWEQHNYYMAGYVPQGKRKSNQFHSIEVKAKRPHVTIRSRLGYLDIPDDAAQAARIETALKFPELFRQITPIVGLETLRGKIRVVTGVSSEEVHFRSAGDKYEGRILFRGMIYTETGKPASKDFSISKGFNLSLTAEQHAGLKGQPLLSQAEVDLPAGKYKLIVIVEDAVAGTLGTAVQEFEIS